MIPGTQITVVVKGIGYVFEYGDPDFTIATPHCIQRESYTGRKRLVGENRIFKPVT